MSHFCLRIKLARLLPFLFVLLILPFMRRCILVFILLSKRTIFSHFLFKVLFRPMSFSFNDSHVLMEPIIGEIKLKSFLVSLNRKSNIFIVRCGILFLEETHLSQHELLLGITQFLFF